MPVADLPHRAPASRKSERLTGSEHSLLALVPLLRLVWCSLVGEMIGIYDKAKENGEEDTCRRVLAILDEAGRLAIPMMHEYIATAAGRGISFWMAFQSPSQIEAVYGPQGAETIKDSTDTKIFYRPASGSFKAADYIRWCLGDTSGYAESQTLRNGEEVSQARSEHARALLTAQEIMRLSDEEIMVFHSNKWPIRAL